MTPEHHDLVLAITSHVPHLIAYNIVGTAADLEEVTRSEVIKFSAGGFRDFTRIAASDPTMWRDVFLNNKDAVLEMLGRFNEDLTALQRMIAAATATGCSTCSPAPARSGAASSSRARRRRRPISAGARGKRRLPGPGEDMAPKRWMHAGAGRAAEPAFPRRHICVFTCDGDVKREQAAD